MKAWQVFSGMGEDYIDTSVWIGALVEEEQRCRTAIQTIGYKHHNDAVIGHPVLSEIMVKILTGLTYDDIQQEDVVKELTFQAFNNTLSELRHENKLRIQRLEAVHVDCTLIETLQDVERELTYDDALHLCLAINNGCERFVTTDQLFAETGSTRLIHELRTNHNLAVKHI